jgi:hypothetical protein
MFFIGQAPNRWVAGFAIFTLSMTGCLDRSEPSSSSTDATSNDAGEAGDVAVGDGGWSSDLCVQPPGPPIALPPDVACEKRVCGEPCNPCEDSRICVDATARGFVCNYALHCVPSDLCVYPPGPLIWLRPHVDCEKKVCGGSCDPCKDPRTCVDATAREFVCNYAQHCVQWERD